jgi:two-component system, NarL family, nitrate/nitrite response regulator NarL
MMEPNAVSRKIRVFVADTSRIHSQLLANALERDPELVVVSWDSNPSSLIPAIVSQKVDILAISSGFGGRPSVSLKIVRELRSSHPGTKSVVLLDSQDADLVTDAFRVGARGVFSRESSVDLFRKCIRSVDRGEIWADNRGISLAVDALASSPLLRTVDSTGLNLLSKREFEVVQCVVQGMTNREIAEHLGLSQHTVKNYLFRVFDKLGVSSRVELLFMALGSRGHVNGSSQPDRLGDVLQQVFEGGSNDQSTVAFAEKAAEQGMPTAQFFLAQSLAARGEPDHSADAYMWFVIAAEQARQARLQLAMRLTPKQIDEAQGKAAAWLQHSKDSAAAADSFSSPDDNARAVQGASVAHALVKPAARNAEPESPTHTPSGRALTYGSA